MAIYRTVIKCAVCGKKIRADECEIAGSTDYCDCDNSEVCSACLQDDKEDE